MEMKDILISTFPSQLLSIQHPLFTNLQIQPIIIIHWVSRFLINRLGACIELLSTLRGSKEKNLTG